MQHIKFLIIYNLHFILKNVYLHFKGILIVFINCLVSTMLTVLGDKFCLVK